MISYDTGRTLRSERTICDGVFTPESPTVCLATSSMKQTKINGAIHLTQIGLIRLVCIHALMWGLDPMVLWQLCG